MVRVRFANFAEDSFARDVLVEDGATLEDLLTQEEVSLDVSSFRVSVNNQIASATDVLKEGDRVRLTPRKMNGA